ncbi:helix-turn-helix domain-containing protein [Pusillimonas sp. TS35]|uniref:helix-turn-helix transcriptional regulator n=1 Tax=Paracandidimonas lactea TaxID=2895524 RepID=UPI00136AC904|nr:helix-turn-helix transcriptional regulator [Paracandidimonas lactea]MYN14487.1 helix-turn-helix domain-containing protein [Pusillimonas sp. TS35]
MAIFTVSDFDRLGSRAGFRYRLPKYAGLNKGTENLCIAEGRIQEHDIRPELRLVLSDIVTHHQYEAASEAVPQFTAIIMLQGQAHAQLESHGNVSMVAQSGASISYGDAVSMIGVHPAGQRLRSVNLSLSSPDCVGDTQLGDTLAKVMCTPGVQFRCWAVQTHLLQAIEHIIVSPWQGAMQRLLIEGVGLQVLAHALAGLSEAPCRESRASARDRQLLERVRERLYSAPGEDHTLAELAALACMSPSTLRAKFQATFHCSIFGWLRERRLEVAREYLAQGGSVQQAAHFVGYRHATNFATAFRARYGIAPSEAAQTRRFDTSRRTKA